MKIVLLGSNSKEDMEKKIQIVASAGCLSRADGTVTDVINSNNDYEKNLKIARAIVNYGHRSISEHDYLVFAIEDVTPIVEQILISYRQTSFTVKSRRNVDFRSVGYYTPIFKNNNNEVIDYNEMLANIYKKHQEKLFNYYGDFVDMGLPIEDARYILPYSFNSNLIMGCDVNELFRITSDLLYSKLSNIDELKSVGLEFKKIIDENRPYMSSSINKELDKDYYKDNLCFVDDLVKDKGGVINNIKFNDEEYENVDLNNTRLLDKVNILKYDDTAKYTICINALANRYNLSYHDATNLLFSLGCENKDIKERILKGILDSKYQREFEQVNYTFEFPISLAALTHITRHRMHSLMFPDFVPLWNMENYIIPDTFDGELKDLYNNIYTDNKNMIDLFKRNGVRDEDLIYFYLSGNACNARTTMNLRNLEWVSRMRMCNKAQWEIRNIVTEMANEVIEKDDSLKNILGPTCKIYGYCNEGKDSCKNRGVVVKKLVK